MHNSTGNKQCHIVFFCNLHIWRSANHWSEFINHTFYSVRTTSNITRCINFQYIFTLPFFCIVSIHAHGAGGHLNCLSELVESTGGIIHLDKLPVGDPTLSAKEIIGNESQERMGRGADIQWESTFGTMMPAYYAMYARAHMEKYGTSLEDLASIRVKASSYGQLNEKAVYRKPVTFDMFSDPENRMSGPVASPLRVGDCCANADGSSCIIVANEEKAKSLSQKPIWIRGLGAASESVNLAGRNLFSGLTVARKASEQAYAMAGIGPKDIDVAEVHDCFTIAELMAYENLGFAEPGEGKDLIRNKETYKEGSIPVNLDGGLLSKGHPIGATGGSQIRTVVLQLREEAGDIQVKNPEFGLVHNIGGVGLYGNVSILGR